MSRLDDRIQEALRETGQEPPADPGLVFGDVFVKRLQRRARRRALRGAAAAVVLVGATAGGLALVERDDGGRDRRVRVATDEPPPPPPSQPANPAAAREEVQQAIADGGPPLPDPATVTEIEFVSDTEALVSAPPLYRGLRVRLVEGRWDPQPASVCDAEASTNQACARIPPEARVSEGDVPLGPSAYRGTPVAVEPVVPSIPEHDYFRGPLLVAGGTAWVAAYERSGATYTFPPSEVVTANPESGEVVTIAELKGEIQSVTEGEGARWAVTRDLEITDAEFRVKRIDADGTATSRAIPLSDVPAGPIVAGAGGVWVPVRDGVLRFDPESGALADRIALGAQQDRRGVIVVDGTAWVTAGTTLQRLDAGGIVKTRLDTAARSPLTDLVVTDDGVWALASASGELFRIDLRLATVEARLALPAGFADARLQAAGGRVLVAGTADLAPPGDTATRSLAVETVVLEVDGDGVTRTIVVAGANDASVTLTEAGALVIASGGDLYRARLP